MSLNWFDYCILAVIALSIIISFFRGFLRETISLITWIAGVIFAIRFTPTISIWFRDMIANETLRYVVTFVLLFIAIFIIGLLMTMLVKRGVNAVGFNFSDRLLGAVFGAVRGILLVSIVLMFMTMTALKNGDALVNSQLSPSFMPVVTWLDGFLPERLQEFTRWMGVNDSALIRPQQNFNKNTSGKPQVFYFPGNISPARETRATATQGERTPAPLEKPQA